MVEWLENHHEWIFIPLVIWIIITFYQSEKNKYNYKRAKKKKEQISQNASPSGSSDLLGFDTGHAKPAGYGGGSGGGAGSTRSFVPASPVNPAAVSEVNHMNGMAAIATNTLNDDISQTALLEGASADIIPNADIIPEVEEMSVESVADNVVELAGEIISDVLNG